ncbi:hypothetical protein MMJ63_20830, partial [Bacillus vallismortis]|nr:hypothetical protein [Bacillus vallismortis]
GGGGVGGWGGGGRIGVERARRVMSKYQRAKGRIAEPKNRSKKKNMKEQNPFHKKLQTQNQYEKNRIKQRQNKQKIIQTYKKHI